MNIYICQTEPYYSNYNTFRITAILEVKKKAAFQRIMLKSQWLAKPLIITWYFHNCVQMFSVRPHSFVLFCFAFFKPGKTSSILNKLSSLWFSLNSAWGDLSYTQSGTSACNWAGLGNAPEAQWRQAQRA